MVYTRLQSSTMMLYILFLTGVMVNQVRSEAIVKSLLPDYGPVSGGTIIQLTGESLPPDVSNTELYIDNTHRFYFTITDGDATHMTAVSPNVRGNDTIEPGVAYNLELKINDSLTSQNVSFTYKPDPEISKITPRKTIRAGGIRQTITGSNLDSVYKPKMLTTLIMNSVSTYKQETKSCTVQNSNTMFCYSPYVKFPTQIKRSVNVRGKRDVIEENFFDDLLNNVKNHEGTVDIYMGFELDGVGAYKNLSGLYKDGGQLYVYGGPELYDYEWDKKIFRTYSPHNDATISVEGVYLQSGCSVEDYVVTLGTSNCANISLFSNKFICTPPQEQPQPSHGNGNPQLLVHIGETFIHTMGKVEYRTSLTQEPAFLYGMIGGSVGLVVVIIIAAVILYGRRRSKLGSRRNRNRPMNDYIPMNDWLDRLPREVKNELKKLLIPHEKVIVGKKIGQGNFGSVHTGQWEDSIGGQNTTVAIKTLKGNMATIAQLKEFLEEALLMSKFNHDNVLELYGVVKREGRPLIILPYMDKGNLKDFVNDPRNSFLVLDLLKFAQQVASGMNYLADKKFTHRDLAARNCMVNSDLVVKVADFGLTRHMENDYYKVQDKQRALPVRWMALESLQKNVFNTKTDVWAFGVVLWELFTRGVKPYPDVDNIYLKDYLTLGRRLDKPEAAHEEVYSLMLKCWKTEPIERPAFDHLSEQLKQMMSQDTSYDNAGQYTNDWDQNGVAGPPNDYLAGPPHDYLTLRSSVAQTPGEQPPLSHTPSYVPMGGRRSDYVNLGGDYLNQSILSSSTVDDYLRAQQWSNHGE